jgi:hypothetical protein
VELARLRDTFADRPATLRAIITVLAGRAYELLMILFVLPFLLPVSVPGTSTPLGLTVATIAAQLAFGRLPWLPAWLLDRQLPAGFLGKVLGVTRGVVAFLERVLRPRALVLTGAKSLNALHLAVIVLAALLLALPLPVPFTNTFPGWTILLIAAGLMTRDGLFIAAGYAVMLGTLFFFYGLGEAVNQSLRAAFRWLTG